MSEYIHVHTTTATEADAQRIASALVERRLAACVHVSGPITSTYRWQGKVETAQEWHCVAKTRRDRYAAVEAAVIELHPYDTPEIVATPIVAGSQRYLTWLDQQVNDA